MALLAIYNGASPTTAQLPPVTTGTGLKTMLQVKASATLPFRIVEWGASFDGSAAATPGKVELIETDVAATVTAAVLADINKMDADAIACGDVTTNLIQVGVNSTGYTASVEGTTTASRLFDYQLIAPTNQYVKQFPLGREPVVAVGKFLRIRLQFGAAINCVCYVVVAI